MTHQLLHLTNTLSSVGENILREPSTLITLSLEVFSKTIRLGLEFG